MTDLIEGVQQISKDSGWDYVEFRGGPSIPSAERNDEFVAHQVELEASEESQTSRLRDSTRRNIQKAIREGVEIQHLQSREAMDTFYSLHCRTRRRHGLPPQPLRFFHLIHKYLIETGPGFVSLARYSGEWIAGAVFLQFGSEAVYKFGASDPGFQHLRANNLLMWEAIRRLQAGGVVNRLSLGRSDRTDEGLLQFKRGWGGTEVELPYYRIALQKRPSLRQTQSVQSKGGVSHKIIQRLPISVLRLVGGIVYRHVG
jgi:lipid II:glycine glycyltransferase (peptidoglycan interpeptide bridge formation enzyme)